MLYLNIAETFSLDEFWSYKESGFYTYNSFVNDSLEKSKEIYFKDDVQYINEYFYNSIGDIKASKKYSIKDSVFTQEFFTGNEVSREEFNYHKISDNCFVLKFVDWNKEPCIKIETMDEVIYIKSKIEENLRLPVDILSMLNH